MELEEELEEEMTLADLTAACSPLTRLALGVLRFFACVLASVISGLYVGFGVMYDSEQLRWLGAVG